MAQRKPRRLTAPSLQAAADAASAAARERRYDAIRRRSQRAGNQALGQIRELCYDASTGTLRGDPDHKLNGVEVMLVGLDEANDRALVRHALLPNQEAYFPLCPDEWIETPPGGPRTVNCCIDERTGLVTCERGLADSYLHGRTIPLEMITCYVDKSSGTRVCDVSTGDERIVFPSCPQPPDLIPPPGTPLDVTGCCIDPVTGIIQCPGGTQQWYMHGRQIPAGQFTCLPDGRCFIYGGGAQEGDMQLPACPQPPDLIPPPGTPPRCCVDLETLTLVCEDPSSPMHGVTAVVIRPETAGLVEVSYAVGGTTSTARFPVCRQPPQRCCYDVAAGKLRCDGAWEGLSVSLLAMQPQEDGSVLAIVMHEDLRPNSTMAFPICDDETPPCCYDPKTQTLRCPDSRELNGTAAGIITSWVGADGQLYVWAVWNGGGARMPVCPGNEECPPVFCCVHLQDFTFVCPGRPELNGQVAPLADVVIEDGYSWAILEDGTRVPLCGEKCPPPQLCPDCPTCPPGQFLSPDGTCHEPPVCPPELEPCPPGMWRDPNGACVPPPGCPQCPPGMLLDTASGRCVYCPACPPCDDEPCCDDCAKGDPCSGCGDARKGRSGGAIRARHAGAVAVRNPTAGDRYRAAAPARKRKIFSGNR